MSNRGGGNIWKRGGSGLYDLTRVKITPSTSKDELHETWLSQDPTTSMVDMHPKNHLKARNENAIAGNIHLDNASRLGQDHPHYQAFIELGKSYHNVAKWHHERIGD